VNQSRTLKTGCLDAYPTPGSSSKPMSKVNRIKKNEEESPGNLWYYLYHHQCVISVTKNKLVISWHWVHHVGWEHMVLVLSLQMTAFPSCHYIRVIYIQT